MNTKNLLLTGPPGCGKSTLIEKLIARIDQPMTGFFTGGLRDRGTACRVFHHHTVRQAGRVGSREQQEPGPGRKIRRQRRSHRPDGRAFIVCFESKRNCCDR